MLKHVSENAKELIHEAASKAIDSKVVGTAVAGTTAALGLSDIQSYAQLAATVAAFLLSVTLIIKHGLDVYREYKKAQVNDEE